MDEPTYSSDYTARAQNLEALHEKPQPEVEPEFKSATGSIRDKPALPGHAVHNLPDRNKYFAGREDILSKISLAIEKSLTVIITGQGGFGKTQIAVEYAHRNLPDYEYVWIFNAESETRLEDDYRDFAMRVIGLESAREQEFEGVWEYVENWLLTNISYLFIFDNAEYGSELRHYLPQGVRGDIIMNTLERVHGIQGARIDVTVFSLDDAVAFIRKRIERTDKFETEALSNALGNLPLALQQATSYIIENRIGINKYLELLRDRDPNILKKVPPYADYDKTVLTAWKISFGKIEDDEGAKPSVCLFKLLAYCAPDDIPLQMFINGRDMLPPPLAAALDPGNELGYDALIDKLARYSLVSMRRDGKGNALLSVHRLVQAAAKHDLEGDAEYLQCCLGMVDNVFRYEYGAREDFDSFALCFPHVIEIARNAARDLADDDAAMIKLGHICSEAGTGLCRQGEFARALEWHEKAMAIRENVLGKEHPDTLSTYNEIAVVYKDQGRYAKALEWSDSVLSIREDVLGAEHPDTARTCNNIACIYSDQGEYETALVWHSKALAIFEKAFGAEHADTAATCNSIAGVFSDQGEYETALEWYNKSLAINEKLLGEEHLETARSCNNIALIYCYQGEYPKALKWYNRALAVEEKVLGVEDPATATTYNNIAFVYSYRDEHSKAL
ncbi:MAG: tetratricopeptide repeat-containing protein, partial [Oscillospiraceae bacterium]|nr:tetratricopeptide repeat-containing protein [Oscillospiraceae bacterium]